MNNSDKFIEIGIINNNKDNWEYNLTSVYIALEKNYSDEEIKNISYKNYVEEEKYLSLLSYELKNEKEIIFFLDNEKLKENFGKDIFKQREFAFPKPIVFTIHIHNMKKTDENMDFNTFYVLILISKKISFTPEANKPILDLKKKMVDDNFIFDENEKNIGRYQIYLKEINIKK